VGNVQADNRNLQDASSLLNLAREKPGQGRRVAVIGSGVAGLTCAHDLALLGHRVTVFEKQGIPGGMLMLGVPEYRLPRDLVQAEIQAVLDLGVELRCNEAVGRDFLLADLKAQGFEAVFIAIGAHVSRGLRIEGVELDGVFRAVEFLLNVNLGYRVDLGERVVVVGGGDVAMDVARSAARGLLSTELRSHFDLAGRPRPPDAIAEAAAMRDAMDVAREAMRTGAKEVRLICLESWEEMPAQRFEIEEALAEGIRISPRLGPKRILGRNGKVSGLETITVRSVFDDARRFNPSYIEGSEAVLECDSVILAIGQSSDLTWVRPEDGIQVSPRGTIVVAPETMATTAPAIFAGGDVAFGPRIFIEGVENGHRAARSIHEYLTATPLTPRRRARWVAVDPRAAFLGERNAGEPFLPSFWKDYRHVPRQEAPALPIERRIGIAEVELGYELPLAREQARRCLKCSITPIFDGARCILCGGCVDICPEYCLRMVPLSRITGDDTLSALVQSVTGSPHSAFGYPLGDPHSAIADATATAIIMDTDRCIRCGLCALRCPTGAITMEMFGFEEGWNHAPA
jgi:NADPH-dependent glutamate synthase beta subunit-like oxidoreductase